MKEEQYSVACLIVGILSCVLCCMCLGIPLGIAGVVLFILSMGNGHGVDTKAGFGLALSIAGFILSVVTIILFILFMLGMTDTDYRYDDNWYDHFSDYGNSLDFGDYYNLPFEFDFDDNFDVEIDEL
jgi:lipoprotein